MRPKERMQAAVDDEVVRRAREGDETAFRTLVLTHSRDVFRLAYRITRNEEDAEDTVQETFIRAYRKLDGFEARANFGTWLYRITANTAIDLLRRKKRHEGRKASLDDVEPGVSGGQESLVFGRQVRERVDSALVSLSELERTAFVLRHCEELSLAEISSTLDITVSATKQAIFRAGVWETWVVSSEGGHPEQLTDGPVGSVYPTWSPDGRWVVSSGVSQYGLWRVPSEGGEEERITQGPAGVACYSPDGSHVYFTGRDDTAGNLWAVFACGRIRARADRFLWEAGQPWAPRPSLPTEPMFTSRGKTASETSG